ncbi:MAG: flagellar M-ring protein FliF [Verrucomicrobiales bacterium]|nr:flagellar M-ring protein FliF [Verrucomicrobiales bacterium]
MLPSLSKVGQQLLAIWKQLGTSQRASILLATSVVLGGLTLFVYWSSQTPYSLLYGRLTDTEAARVIAALDEAKVPYRIGAGGGTLYVPADRVHATRMQLAGRGIPRGDGVGFEIFDKPNFGISDFVQRANFVRAVQGELARTISQLDDIESARVMIALPENRLLIDKDKHPTASVFVRLRGQSPLAPQAIQAIRFLVANSVEGLKPSFVSIIDNSGNPLSEHHDEDSFAGLATTQLAARRNLELYLARKAEGMLEKVLGPGQAIVRVSAEINFDTLSRIEEKFDPDGQVIRSQTKNDENNDTITGAPAGDVVGISANTPGETNATSVATNPVTNTKDKKTVSTVEYEVSKSTINYSQSGGAIKRLSTAVTVAARTQGAGPNRQILSRTPEEKEALKRVVQSALGTDPERGDQIVLEEMVFNDETTSGLAERFALEERRHWWLQLGRTALYPALALAILLVFLRLFHRTPADALALGIPLPPLGRNGHTHGNGHSNGHGPNPLPSQWPSEPNVVTVEVLNQLVRENPANMTQAIRAWLTRGSPPPK